MVLEPCPLESDLFGQHMKLIKVLRQQVARMGVSPTLGPIGLAIE